MWENLVSNLDDLAAILNREPNTERAAEYLYRFKGKFDHDWRRNQLLESPADGIPLPPPRIHNLHPTGCTVTSTFLNFIFKAPERSPFPERADFQVKVTGTLALRSERHIQLEDHWRVDTHHYHDQEQQGTSNLPREPHPFIHFQRGGHAQDEFASEEGFVPGPSLDEQEGCAVWRGLMQTPGPRIPTLPMCPLIAIDFTIAQNDGSIWHALRNVPEYSQLIGKAQKRLWSPIFEALTDIEHQRRWIGTLLVRS